ncbi:hypothetical protein [Enterobacter hormaechei]|uniref:hypothetical protein n=1 Tax=Enterobacter hormaechei TaxID=158836 RepID=UPI00388E277C
MHWGQFVGENGQWQLKVEAPAIVLPDEDAVDAIDEPDDEPQDDELDDDEIEVDEDGGEEHTEEKEPEENQQAALKPVFKPAKNNGDGTYQIEFEYDGKHYAGPAQPIALWQLCDLHGKPTTAKEKPPVRIGGFFMVARPYPSPAKTEGLGGNRSCNSNIAVPTVGTSPRIAGLKFGLANPIFR